VITGAKPCNFINNTFMTASRDQGNAPRARRFGRAHVSAWLFRLILALLLIVGAMLVAVFSFEQSTLRPLAEFLVERATGRAFSIEGELDARAGRIISLRAGRISLANADWGSSDKLLSIDEAEVSIDLSHLLDGVLAIDKVMVNGVKLLFEQDAQGLSNWAMVADEAPSPPGSESSGVMDTTGDNPPTPAIESGNTMAFPVIHSQLSNIDITVHNAALPQPIKAHFDSIEHSAAQGNELRATAVGAVQSRPLNLQARIGPLTQLLDAGAVNFDLKADFETAELDVNGQLDNLLTPRQATLHVSLVSPEISQILTTFGLPEIVHGAAELKVSLQASDDHHKLDLAASIDSLKLNAKARLQALNTIDGASITVSAAGPDLAAAASLAGLNGLPRQSFKLESSAALSGKLLTIGETGFDTGDSHLTAKGSMSQFPRLEGTNLKLQLVGKNYLDFAELLGIKEVAEFEPEPFEVNANLGYSTQDQQQFTAQVTLADVGGDFNATLTGYPAYVGSQLDYRLEGQNDGLIQRLLGRPTRIEGAYALRGKVKRTATGFGIDSAVLSVGANDLQVSGMIGEDPLRGDTELTMRFQGPDLDKFVALAGYTGFLPAGSAEINAAARAQDKGIHLDNLTVQLGRNRLKASGLISLQDGVNGSRVKIALAGEDIVDVLPPDLHAFVDPQQSFELAGTLATDSGQLAISELQARLGEVNLQASATVSTLQPLTDMSLTLDVRGPDLAAVIPEDLVPYRLPAAKFSVSGDVALTESGLTLHGIKALVGPDRLELSGTIPLDTPTDGLNLVITASGPNLRELIPLETGQLEFTEQPYQLAGKIQLAEGVVSVQQIDFATPQGHLSGQLSASLLNPRQFGQFDLKAKGDNLAEFSPSMPGYSPATVPFNLDARGSWDSEMVSIDRGILQLDDARIEVQGTVDLPPNVAATRLVLSARGDNMTDLGQFAGLPLLPNEFSVEASLQGDANGFEIPELNARVGESDLRGSIQVDFADKPLIKVNLESELLNLAERIPLEESSTEVDASAQSLTSDSRLIRQLPVPVDQLNAINLETRIRLRELRLVHHTLRNIEIDTRLQDGDLTVTRLRATAAQGQLIASFRTVADGDRIVTSGKLEGKDILFGSAETKGEGNSFPKQDLQLEFESSGATVRELAANLNGHAQFTGGTGRMHNSLALGLFGSFASELLSAVNPLVTREPYTTISCFGAYAEIIDGVAKINPGAVMQTDKLNMFAIGQVDLNTEQVNLRFNTSARSGIGISVADFVNPFVGVSGTLANPRLGVDPDNAMFAGGFAVATGGLSIVAKSLYNRWFGEKDPCVQLQQQAQEVQESRSKQQDSTPGDQ
jgi:uncharacterized protein involved in outer membrane biogenesis